MFSHRRRLAALALLPCAAIATTMSITLAAAGADQRAAISASEGVVDFGKQVQLAGSVPGQPVTGVGLQFRPAGSADWHAVTQTQTDAAGNYTASVRALRSGTYQAVPSSGEPSAPEKVAVRARTTLRAASHNPLAGQSVRLHGRVLPAGRRKVKVLTGSGVVPTRTDAHGRYSVRWTPAHAGDFRLRALSGANALARSGRSHARKVTAFRGALASWYGPGLYGNGVACGGTLQPDTMGVANKSLPCGTKLTLRYHGRSVQATVIDRGPYAGGREFDLTEAVKNVLHFPGVGTVLVNR